MLLLFTFTELFFFILFRIVQLQDFLMFNTHMHTYIYIIYLFYSENKFLVLFIFGQRFN